MTEASVTGGGFGKRRKEKLRTTLVRTPDMNVSGMHAHGKLQGDWDVAAKEGHCHMIALFRKSPDLEGASRNS